MNGLLHDDPILNVILLFFMIIVARSWILGICLSCVRSRSLVLPELPSLRLGQERLWLLPNELPVGGGSQVVICRLFNGHDGLVRTWPRGSRLQLALLAVGDL